MLYDVMVQFLCPREGVTNDIWYGSVVAGHRTLPRLDDRRTDAFYTLLSNSSVRHKPIYEGDG
jgi:hypothetical protein